MRLVAIALILLASCAASDGCVDFTDGFLDGFRETIKETT